MRLTRVHVSGAWYPHGTLQYYERAFARVATASYVGLPFGIARAGVAGDADLSALETDLLFYVDEWKPFFPRGLERAPYATAAFFTDTVYDLDHRLRMAPFFDHVFVAHRNHLEEFERVHPSAHWLPFAADPEVHRRHDVPRDLDVAFVGGVSGPRAPVLEALAREFTTNDFRRRQTPQEMAETYSRARVVFNMANVGEVNMRIFEGTSSGAALVTQSSAPGIGDLFRVGEEIVTYDDARDAVRVVRDLLADEPRRAGVAEAGHAAVRSRHTYEHRARAVLDVALKAGAGSAPARAWGPRDVERAYARVYASFPMLDALRSTFAASTLPRGDRIAMLPPVVGGFARAWRRMGWRGLVQGGGPRR